MKKHRIESLNFRDSLMIGDLVYEGSTVHEWEYVDYLRSQKGMEGVKPIPLTDEILEANGLRRYGGNLWYKPWDGTPYPHLYFFVEIKEGSSRFLEREDLTFRCRYVHQLQHALRVCDLDDYVYNFKIE